MTDRRDDAWRRFVWTKDDIVIVKKGDKIQSITRKGTSTPTKKKTAEELAAEKLSGNG
jgi:hypothetical protein